MKCLYLEAILNGRMDLLINEELSIIICSRVPELSLKQPARVIGQSYYVARPCTYTVTLLYRSAKVK